MRCTLEVDLASRHFVLCSMSPGGPMQTSLSTVVTNDPNEAAWLFLRARGPRSFHVLGRLNIDNEQVSRRSRTPSVPTTVPADQAWATAGSDDEEAWPDASAVISSKAGSKFASSEGGGGQGDGIEVLLPAGNDVLEYPLSDVASDEGSDDFVQFMMGRVGPGGGAPKRPAPGAGATTVAAKASEAGVKKAAPSKKQRR